MQANGFFNSNGISKYVPHAYAQLERQFYKEIVRAKKRDLITISEYKRPEWTYHAKGLWIYMNDNRHPCVTLIGSPNYGDRSTERDLEAEVILLTKNENLQKAVDKAGIKQNSECSLRHTAI